MPDQTTWYFDPAGHRLIQEKAPGAVALPALDGILDTGDTALAWAVDDFGRTTALPPPLGVLRPGSVDDISTVLRFAGEHGIAVVARAEGHSTSGQAQAPAGIVLDMRGLNAVHLVTADRIVVEAGARWSQVLETTLPLGAAPPVLTDYLELSVGGTLSVGGISGATHQHGLQTDNVLELDAITHDGVHVTCSPDTNPDLFEALRAGRGHHGIIVRATLRLVPAHTHARWYRLRYHDLDTFLADQRTLMTEGRFHHLEGQATPEHDGTWTYRIDAAIYFTPPATPVREQLLAGLADQRDALEINDLTYHGFQNRLAPGVELLRTLGPWQGPHPWLNLLLPDHTARQVLAETFSTLTPADLGDDGVILVYPVPRSRIRTPRVRLPEAPIVFLFAILRSTPPDDATALNARVQANHRVQHRATAAGGTVYLGAIET
ncbi:FAD-binding protein [Saccharothrix sp. BKS2]|uniref:FAD-binding protein n=1 Tax=Saccharothrix sp. BKS2 TaxID=3064400 RepID=UPI0039E9A942